jgi:hypothetical protein
MPKPTANNNVILSLAAADNDLTWSDFDILFRPMLVHGFSLIKHGRSGLPKRRRFWMTNRLNRLYWDTSKFIDVLRTGERHIDMTDVMSLIDGVGTSVLQRATALGGVSRYNENRFFSLVTTTRTFDLEAMSVAQVSKPCDNSCL